MSFELEFSQQADLDIQKHKKAGDKATLAKISKLLNELYDDPFTGTGKPESLKFNLTGRWARRINKEHRLVYKVKKTRFTSYRFLAIMNRRLV